jgi:hypothetical protein
MLLAHSWIIVLLSSLPGVQSTPPQTPPQQTAPKKAQAGTPKIDPAIVLPVDLDRIQRALAKTPMLRFDEQNRPVFRVQVFGEKPTIDDILGPDWAKGPVPYGGMTHQEFLNMVTPTEARGYAGFTNKEGMTVAATSFLLQWTLQKAIRKFNETTDERAREAARKEVVDALNALEEARAKAGLPPK